jgi:hypothetical protein
MPTLGEHINVGVMKFIMMSKPMMSNGYGYVHRLIYLSISIIQLIYYSDLLSYRIICSQLYISYDLTHTSIKAYTP